MFEDMILTHFLSVELCTESHFIINCDHSEAPFIYGTEGTSDVSNLEEFQVYISAFFFTYDSHPKASSFSEPEDTPHYL